MGKYLFIGTYTTEGAKGVLKDGGSKRRQVVQNLMSHSAARSRRSTSVSVATTSTSSATCQITPRPRPAA